MGLKQVSFVEKLFLSRRVPYRRFHCTLYHTVHETLLLHEALLQHVCSAAIIYIVMYTNKKTHATTVDPSYTVKPLNKGHPGEIESFIFFYSLRFPRSEEVQWNLRTRDTMGPMILSLVERSSLSRRSNNTLKY